MVRNVYANTKKAFSLMEFLVALLILTLISVALLNSIVFFLHKSLEKKVVYLTSKAVDNLYSYPKKVENCNSHPADACAAFQNNTDCKNSLSCNKSYCSDNNKCVVCVPQEGKIFYYSFNASLVENSTKYKAYKLNVCWKLGVKKGVKKKIIYFAK
jgi:prepilin-type N-terminal cleavage/methylation domain-containing protein